MSEWIPGSVDSLTLVATSVPLRRDYGDGAVDLGRFHCEAGAQAALYLGGETLTYSPA